MDAGQEGSWREYKLRDVVRRNPQEWGFVATVEEPPFLLQLHKNNGEKDVGTCIDRTEQLTGESSPSWMQLEKEMDGYEKWEQPMCEEEA